MVRFIIIPVPYEWVERFFGTYIADHFNEISWTLFFLGFLIWALFGRRSQKKKIYYEIQVPSQREFNYCIDEKNHYIPDLSDREKITAPEEPEDQTIYQAQHGAWSPTGWIYDRDTKKWDPPEYLSEESEIKWRWNEEKRIWIDQEKEAKMRKYQAYRRSQGLPPSYEEWKAQKLKEQQETQTD